MLVKTLFVSEMYFLGFSKYSGASNVSSPQVMSLFLLPFLQEIWGLTCLSWKFGPVLCLSLFFYSMALNTLLNKNLALLNIPHSKITLLLCMIRRLTSSIFEKEICIRDDMENSCQLCDISYSCNHFSKCLSFERTSAKLLLTSSSNKILDSLRNCLTHYSAGGGQRVLLLRATT